MSLVHYFFLPSPHLCLINSLITPHQHGGINIVIIVTHRLRRSDQARQPHDEAQAHQQRDTARRPGPRRATSPSSTPRSRTVAGAPGESGS